MAPPPRSAITGITCFEVRNMALTFTRMTRSQRSGVSSTTEPWLPMPTLLSRTSMPP